MCYELSPAIPSFPLAENQTIRLDVALNTPPYAVRPPNGVSEKTF